MNSLAGLIKLYRYTADMGHSRATDTVETEAISIDRSPAMFVSRPLW